MIQAKFRCYVVECSVLGGVVAIPATGCEAGRIRTYQTRCLPAVDERLDRGGKVTAFVNDPANPFRDRRRGEEACAKGRIGACATEDIVYWWFRWEVVDLI